jgi:hypothetical protein
MYLQVSVSVQHCVHIGVQVLHFGGFWITEFWIRDIEPVVANIGII